MPRSLESDLVLHFFPMSHKKDTRLIWVNISSSEKQYGTAPDILILIELSCNESSAEPAQISGLHRAFAARIQILDED